MEHLQMLETAEDLDSALTSHEGDIKRLRALVLAPILAHHDDRRRWSLRSVAPLVNGACGHCQRGLPKALLIHMEMGGSVGLCPECGDYLYLDDRSLGVVQ